jgi:hypothetical protein
MKETLRLRSTQMLIIHSNTAVITEVISGREENGGNSFRVYVDGTGKVPWRETLQTQNYDHALYTMEVLRLYGRQLRSKEDVQYRRECGSAHPATKPRLRKVGVVAAIACFEITACWRSGTS